MKLLTCFWRSVGELISSKFVPALRPELHKGQMGRIAIIGGSPDYTGAPYYSGEAALRFGADLSSIYCALEATVPIKSYSPEVMVTPFYAYGAVLERQNVSFNTEPLLTAVPRMHAYTVGPGLGRDAAVGQRVLEVLQTLISAGKLVTIDADGLWLLSSEDAGLDVVRGAHNVVLTPNTNEFGLLTEAVARRLLRAEGGWVLEPGGFDAYLPVGAGAGTDAATQVVELLRGIGYGRDLTSLGRRVSLLSRVLGGVTVLLKGEQDIVSAAGGVGDYAFVVGVGGGETGGAVAVPASLKRCGGQGDILSGCVSVASYWGSLLSAGVNEVFAEFLEATSVGNTTTSMSVDGDVVPPPQCHNLSEVQKGNIIGCVLASVVVKTASGAAFVKVGRGMTAVNVLDEVSAAFHLLTANKQ